MTETLNNRLAHLLQQSEKLQQQKYKEFFYHRKQLITEENFNTRVQSDIQFGNCRPVQQITQNCGSMGIIDVSAQFTLMVDVTSNKKLAYTTAIAIMSKEYRNLMDIANCWFMNPEVMPGLIQPIGKDQTDHTEYILYVDSPILIQTNVLPFLNDFWPLMRERKIELETFTDAAQLLYQTKGKFSKLQLAKFLDWQTILTLTGKDYSMLTHPKGYYEPLAEKSDAPLGPLPDPIPFDPNARLKYFTYAQIQKLDEF